jgi:hypothetical protein
MNAITSATGKTGYATTVELPAVAAQSDLDDPFCFSRLCPPSIEKPKKFRRNGGGPNRIWEVYRAPDQLSTNA